MNCFNHINTPAVSTCIDCSRGLCHVCTKYTFSVCDSCNNQRIKNEKLDIVKKLCFDFIFASLLTYFMYSIVYSKLNTSYFRFIVNFYIFYSIPTGWRVISRFTRKYNFTLPIFLWLFYFVLRFVVGYFIGIFILPYELYKSILRLTKLNKTLATI